MNWNAIFGIACTLAFLLPVAAIVYYKLYKHRSLASLALLYIITALYNFLAQNLFSIPSGVIKIIGVVSNLADTPLILTALLFFCPIKQKQRPVHLLTLSFIVYEILIVCLFGFKVKSIIYVVGPGLAIVLIYTFYLFARQVRFTVMYGKNLGKAIMLAAILFAYGCYALVYVFFYIQKTPNVADAYLIYNITSVVSCIMLTVGLHLIRKRMRELQEVKNTRRELAMFFNS